MGGYVSVGRIFCLMYSLTGSGATWWILLNRLITGDKFSSKEVSEMDSVS